MFAASAPTNGLTNYALLQDDLDANIAAVGGDFNVTFFGFNVEDA